MNIVSCVRGILRLFTRFLQTSWFSQSQNGLRFGDHTALVQDSYNCKNKMSHIHLHMTLGDWRRVHCLSMWLALRHNIQPSEGRFHSGHLHLSYVTVCLDGEKIYLCESRNRFQFAIVRRFRTLVCKQGHWMVKMYYRGFRYSVLSIHYIYSI